MAKESQFDRLMGKIKNHKTAAVLGVAIAGIILLGNLTDAFKSLAGLLPESSSGTRVVNVPKPPDAGTARSIRATAWGTEEPKSAYVTVDASQIVNEKDLRLFVIAKLVDNAVDSYADTRIDKSAVFAIDSAIKRMEVAQSQDTLKRLVGAGGSLQLFVFIVPDTFDAERVTAISDVFKQNGALGANPSFLIPPGGAGPAK